MDYTEWKLMRENSNYTEGTGIFYFWKVVIAVNQTAIVSRIAGTLCRGIMQSFEHLHAL